MKKPEEDFLQKSFEELIPARRNLQWFTLRIDRNFNIIKDHLEKDEIYTIEEALVLQVGEEQSNHQLNNEQKILKFDQIWILSWS